jgi:acyl-CoA oxidase
MRGELETLGQLHASSSGLKALSTELGSNAIETCRRATGGHGYLLMSGLPRLYAATVAACTYEGENTVLYLQSARYLLKILDQHHEVIKLEKRDSVDKNTTDNQVPHPDNQNNVSLSGTKYLITDSSRNIKQDMDELHDLLETVSFDDESEEVARNERICQLLTLVLRAVAQKNLLETRGKLKNLIEQERLSPERAWIALQLDLIHAAKGHLIQDLLSNYLSWVRVSPTDIRVVMTRLCLLLFSTLMTTSGICSASGDTGEYLRVGMRETDVSLVRKEITRLLQLLRPDAVALVDSFDFHDVVLMSSLGE